nr:PREDICTED: uncharacterized protein LOC107769541 [Nicotiana tabacum]
MLLLRTFGLRPGESRSNWTSRRRSPTTEQADNHMNFIIWNCRGALSTEFRRNFRSLLDYNRPALVVLLETHCQTHQNVKENFNFDGMIEVAATRHFGGIAILWLSSVLDVDPVATTAQEIHYHVLVKPLPFTFLFTIIYASNELVNRQSLWENFMSVYDNYKGPWIIGGDFNEITHVTDKFGGLPINNSRSHKFLDCLNYCQMTDLGYKGSRYTWTNGRHKKQAWMDNLALLPVIDNFTTTVQEWNKSTFGNIFKQKRKILARLSGIQSSIHYPTSNFLQNLEHELKLGNPSVQVIYREQSRIV